MLIDGVVLVVIGVIFIIIFCEPLIEIVTSNIVSLGAIEDTILISPGRYDKIRPATKRKAFKGELVMILLTIHILHQMQGF
jgi:hypothetical protein